MALSHRIALARLECLSSRIREERQRSRQDPALPSIATPARPWVVGLLLQPWRL